MPPVTRGRDVIAVAMLKGGTGKTTAAAHVAHALHERGRRVVLGDADPQHSALTWAHLAAFPFPTFPTGMRLPRDLAALPADVDAVVIDTPGVGGEAVVDVALDAATHVLVPLAPTGLEVERLRALAPRVHAAGAPPCGVLLVRTIPHAAMTVIYREQLRRDGWWVLRGAVGRLELYANVEGYGERVERAGAGPYGDAVDELLAVPGARR